METDWNVVVGAIMLSTSLVLGWVVAVRLFRWIRAECEPLIEGRSDGLGFDPSEVRLRVESVRQDFEAAVHEKHVRSFAHDRLLTATRRIIAAFAYFRDRNAPK